MQRHIIISATIILLTLSAAQADAGEMKLGNDLSIQQNSDSQKTDMKSRIDTLSKPYDDVKISDGISAGIISDREEAPLEYKQRIPAKEKGRDVGVGLSLSF
ncbi:hypothetical protein [Maridesulfovibrio sp. FT414]|uniref:hypothetical protein n=1 Tax=Maridesulfovibrio sp. FT414 TaxID=2979469 RepID=UPI003D800D1D